MTMKLWKSIFAVPALCAAVAACESNTKFKEDKLSSAGFKAIPPTTPAQLASLKSLPPHKLVQTTRKGKTVWVYSDPTICGCLYVGNQAAHDAYLNKQNQQSLLDMTTVTLPADQSSWDFSPWPEFAAEP
ncbi:MAG TPA: hypothetical protein VG224_19555 [Reyranella sp.]|jgi:hypothetical protein|nr:hypothetical protein [Reyranella sp.]